MKWFLQLPSLHDPQRLSLSRRFTSFVAALYPAPHHALVSLQHPSPSLEHKPAPETLESVASLDTPPLHSARNLALHWAELPAVPPKDGIVRIMDDELTAVRWVRKCCPELSHALIEKLFRLRQVRTLPEPSQSHEVRSPRLRRVPRKERVGEGTALYLPKSVLLGNMEAEQDLKKKGAEDEKVITVGKKVNAEQRYKPTIEESEQIRNLVFHMDEHVIAINKPPGLAVQGGVGVNMSLDALLGPALSFKYKDSPKLVHRLDKQTSGVMVLGRTSESTALLHSLFRAKTASAISGCKATLPGDGVIERKYWALVIGIPNQRKGRITASLKKVVLDGGKSDAIVMADDESAENSLEAITEYEALGPSILGCTWLELHPLTGRKHQLRVHCAEALGMPIVGDYKYGRQSHDKWPWTSSAPTSGRNEVNYNTSTSENGKTEMRNTVKHHSQVIVEGSVASEKPLLHLHSRMLTIPKVKELAVKLPLQGVSNAVKKAFIDKLRLVAPLPPHMKASWDFLPPPGKTARLPGE